MDALRGEIRIPYEWTAGEAPGRFLTALRDGGEILGARCAECAKVCVPPGECCGFCGARTAEYVPVGDRGVVVSYTRLGGGGSSAAPLVLALIRLDGASTGWVHRLGPVAPEELRRGLRVRAVWEERRVGSVLDIRHFVAEGRP